MSENQSKPKLNWVFEQLDGPRPIHQKNQDNYEPIDYTLKAEKDTISVKLEGKSPQQILSAVQPWIQEYNKNPDRQWDLFSGRRKDEAFIQRLAKDSLPKKQGT